MLRFRLEKVYCQLFSPVNQVATIAGPLRFRQPDFVTRGRNFHQFLIFLPVVVSLVAISLLFKMLMNPQLGQINQILKSLGIPPSQFLTSHETALYSVIGVDIWKALASTW